MSKKKRNQLSKEPETTMIESLTHEGRGVAHINGKTTFIRYALPNETATFIRTLKRGSFDEGYAIEIENPSINRVNPPCPHFQICGGCSLQHMTSQAQLDLKQKVLLDQLQHFGKIQPKNILPPLTSQTVGYRRKARLGVRYVLKKEKMMIGFREANGRYITDMDSCPILDPSIGTKIPALKTLVAGLSIFEDIPQIEVAVGDEKTALIFRHLKPFLENDLAQLKQFAIEHDIEIYLQPNGLESIHKLYPNDHQEFLTYRIEMPIPIEYRFHPCDFTQVNAEINRSMILRAIEFLDLKPTDRVLDLFCGLGNFSLPMAALCSQVVGIEGDEKMVERARANAKLNHIENTLFYSADLFLDVSKAEWIHHQYDKILLDPPRSGALEILPYLVKLGSKKIVYISCNPATLARDAGVLVHDYGYQLTHAGIMDMFPHTNHVESIAIFK